VAKVSAGLLVYRKRPGTLEVLLAHPGGPFWAKRDSGAWSIPKGEVDAQEPPLDAARREFHEETGFTVSGAFTALSPLRQPGGKVVHAWAVAGDCDPTQMRSNLFRMEWPPRSGKQQEFPEIDRVEWFAIDEALRRILPGQAGFLRQLATLV
jgi:predicted NUDIX family NTP pyrophosphohydrolase